MFIKQLLAEYSWAGAGAGAGAGYGGEEFEAVQQQIAIFCPTPILSRILTSFKVARTQKEKVGADLWRADGVQSGGTFREAAPVKRTFGRDRQGQKCFAANPAGCPSYAGLIQQETSSLRFSLAHLQEHELRGKEKQQLTLLFKWITGRLRGSPVFWVSRVQNADNRDGCTDQTWQPSWPPRRPRGQSEINEGQTGQTAGKFVRELWCGCGPV